VILPPLTSQFLNVTKNSSLAAAIAFPDLVRIRSGTALNIIGQALEIMFITLMVNLGLSLLTSFMTNRYEDRHQVQTGGVA
jgi:general L-amino acid transport system permease protein